MKKRLTIIRHAKSDWSHPDKRDIDRPLNKRGKRDAPVMASKFSVRCGNIDAIVSSPANRALTTAEIFQETIGLPKDPIIINDSIYEAGPQDLLKVINGLNDDWEHVMMFGHNPGFSHIVMILSEEYITMSTCAIAELEIHSESWKSAADGTASLINLDYPKLHPELQ